MRERWPYALAMKIQFELSASFEKSVEETLFFEKPNQKRDGTKPARESHNPRERVTGGVYWRLAAGQPQRHPSLALSLAKNMATIFHKALRERERECERVGNSSKSNNHLIFMCASASSSSMFDRLRCFLQRKPVCYTCVYVCV